MSVPRAKGPSPNRAGSGVGRRLGLGEGRVRKGGERRAASTVGVGRGQTGGGPQAETEDRLELQELPEEARRKMRRK